MPDVLTPLTTRLAERLAAIDVEGLRRTLRPPAGIDLCSNDYLSLSGHSLLKQRMADAVMAEGVGSTGSRLLRGERSGFARVEEKSLFPGPALGFLISTGRSSGRIVSLPATVTAYSMTLASSRTFPGQE